MIRFYTERMFNMNDVRRIANEFYSNSANEGKNLVLPTKNYNPIRYNYNVLNKDGDSVASYTACTIKSLNDIFGYDVETENGQIKVLPPRHPNPEFIQFDKSSKIKSFKDFYKN